MESLHLPPTGEPSLGDLSLRVLALRVLALRVLALRVLDHISAMVAYWDTDQRCRFANQAYRQWFGRSRAEILGMSMRELLGPIYQLNLPHILAALRGEQQIFERSIHTPSGEIRHSIATYTPDLVDGIVRGFFVHVADVSPLKAAQQEMRKAQQAAEDASRAKSAFLAHMSHEIRTPMNAILGLTQIVSGTPLDPQQADYVRKITSAGRSLLSILDDILDFSKVEAGKLVLTRRELSLDDLLDELASVIAATVDKTGIEIAFLIGPDVPHRILGDPGRLRQVLINLLRNAVRFTDQGEIVLSIEREEAGIGGPAYLRFSIRDTGIGIAAEQLDRIFEGFNQVDSASNRSVGGTGLGLAISRRLVRLMGGELCVESTPGSGSLFHFRIPVECVTPDHTSVQAHPQRRILALCPCCSSTRWSQRGRRDPAGLRGQRQRTLALARPSAPTACSISARPSVPMLKACRLPSS
ncbi:MAG: ATP-binding protein [Polyangia bacterium]